jgi:hypothetical protein
MNKLKSLSLVCMLIGAVLFMGCNDKEEQFGVSSITSITATVERGNAYDSKIDNVVALLATENHQVKTVIYENGKFTIDLPAVLNESYLMKIDDGNYPALKVSNKNVKGVSIKIDAYQSGICVGNFYYAKSSSLQTEALFVYVDGDVKITGSDSSTNINRDPYGNIIGEQTFNISYNVSLKKGWNIMYFTETHSTSGQKTSTSETVTTNIPDGMKWYFNGPGEREFQPKGLCPIFPPTPQKLIRISHAF